MKKKRFEEAKLAAIKKKEEEEKQKEQELLAAKAAANAKAKAEESDDAADDWEAEDWDEKDVLLPAQKEEQERLKKLEEERIRKEEAKALQAKKMAATNNKEKTVGKSCSREGKSKSCWRPKFLPLPMHHRTLMTLTQILTQIRILLTIRHHITAHPKMRRNALVWITSRSFAFNVSTALRRKKRRRPQINSDVPLFVSLVTSIQVKQNFLIT